MEEITYLLDKTNSTDDIILDIKNKNIDQKNLYVGSKSTDFYTTPHTSSIFYSKFWEDQNTMNDYIEDLKNNLNLKDSKLCFVGIGSGNAKKELEILEKINLKDISIFITDYSKNMLKMAQDNLKKSNYNCNYVCGNFFDESFHFYIHDQQKKERTDKALYILLGGTFGNCDTHKVISNLAKILKRGDFLYFDIPSKDNITSEDELIIIEAYKDMLKNKERMYFYSNHIISLGLDKNKIDFNFELKKDNSLKTLEFNFYLKLLENINIRHNNINIELKSTDKIKILEIRIFSINELLKLFKENNLELVSLKRSTGGYSSNILIKKIN